MLEFISKYFYWTTSIQYLSLKYAIFMLDTSLKFFQFSVNFPPLVLFLVPVSLLRSAFPATVYPANSPDYKQFTRKQMQAI